MTGAAEEYAYRIYNDRAAAAGQGPRHARVCRHSVWPTSVRKREVDADFFYPCSAASASTVREAAVFLCLESNEFCGALYGQTNTCLVQTRAHTMNHLAIG